MDYWTVSVNHMTIAADSFVFNLDPVLIRLGPVQIRYYGAIFALTLLISLVLWRRQMRRGGYPPRAADGLIVWGVLAVIVGARLGHFLFYNPRIFIEDPLTVLQYWRGGLASHGAMIGMLIALILYARHLRRPVLEIVDRFAFSAAVGSAGIRLGNFLNSEIVGRPTDLPWAVVFARYDHLPRHPSQLYEFAMGLAVLAVLVWVDRRAGRENRPLGLLTGVWLTGYFAGRLGVEFVKEYQGLGPEYVLTTGQFLSIGPLLAGLALLLWVRRHPRPTSSLPRPAAAQEDKKQPHHKGHRGRRAH